MKTGFAIQCLKCGESYKVTPGPRPFRSEPITFGTDNYGADHISCKCGNTIEEHSYFKDRNLSNEFIVEWRDITSL